MGHSTKWSDFFSQNDFNELFLPLDLNFVKSGKETRVYTMEYCYNVFCITYSSNTWSMSNKIHINLTLLPFISKWFYKKYHTLMKEIFARRNFRGSAENGGHPRN